MPRRVEKGSSGPPKLGWEATLACGVLLGAAACLLETVEQPMADPDLAAIWTFMRSAAPSWCVSGIWWAFFARAAEQRLAGPALVLVTVLAALVFGSVMATFDGIQPLSGGPGGLPMDARTAHVVWANAFYGGLYVAAFVGSRRAIRSRWALARVRQARDQSAALLEETRLEAFRRQLQPDTVLDALNTLRRLYRDEPARADDLLDVLVGFLRLAVRSLGGEGATVAAELELAQRYLQLRDFTAAGARSVTVEIAPPAPDSPFPPRLLLPVLERLCLAGGRVALKGGWRENTYHLTVTAEGAPPAALSPALLQRMGVASARARLAKCAVVQAADRLVWSFEFDRA